MDELAQRAGKNCRVENYKEYRARAVKYREHKRNYHDVQVIPENLRYLMLFRSRRWRKPSRHALLRGLLPVDLLLIKHLLRPDEGKHEENDENTDEKIDEELEHRTLRKLFLRADALLIRVEFCGEGSCQNHGEENCGYAHKLLN